MKKSTYMTRAMKASDPRFARVLGQLGYERADVVAGTESGDSLDHAGDERKGDSKTTELDALRAEYNETVGKRAYHGWDVDTIKNKIAEAKD